jgi:polysaccharide export outer membrane protein
MERMRWPFNARGVAINRNFSVNTASLVLLASSLVFVSTAAIAQMQGGNLQGGNSIADRHDGTLGMPSNTPSGSTGRGLVTSQVTSTVSLPGDTLGANDLIEIMVPYCPELSRNFRIGADGVLRLPLLHQGIEAAGLTPDQIATSIKNALVKEQVLAEPTVNIAVVEFRSRTVSVTGAVVHPLTFQATGEVTLLDAIAMAGGVSAGVGADVLVTSTHRTEGKMERTVQTIPVHNLLAQGSPANNLLLHGGEEIRVTEAGKVFIAGNVVKPGMYVMQGDEDTTVIKALALSQGLQSFSANTAYIYRRSTSDGSRKEITVPLSRIIARKEPDVPLVADDILYIPNNNGKRISARVLTGLAGFGQATASGMLIYR